MTWEPATESERRMQDVLRQGDQESYFLLLSRGDLYIPVAPGNSAWATWSTEDRTHVLAFTSDSALRACLREHAGPHRRVRVEELVHTWPDDEWWLAVNPGLPIEGYLPAWFVKQVSTGDVSLPVDESAGVQSGQMPVYGGGFGQEEQQQGGYRAEPAYPSYGPAEPAYQQPSHLQPGGGFPQAEPEYQPLQLPTRFPEEQQQPAYNDYAQQPATTASGLPARNAYAPPESAYAPPQPESSFAPPAPAYAPDQAFQPAGLQSDRGYADADYAPSQGYAAEQGYAPEPAYAPEQPAYDADRGYQYDDAGYQPEHAPYGVNNESGYPDEAYAAPVLTHQAPPETSPAPPTPAGLLPEPAAYALSGPTEDEVEDELAAAGAAGDTPRFLRALLSGWVYVPLNDGAPENVRPGDPGFTWRTDLIDGAYSLTVFTSPTRMSRRLGPCDFVKVTFVRVARNWPDRSYSLAINPGTEVGANMPGTQMSTLISWAGKKGLIERADMMEQSAEAAVGLHHDDLSAGGYSPAPSEQRKLGPTLMQKLIPAAQVPFYLQRGYDRIAGFVHPAEDLGDFDTPESLRTALGLIHDGASDVYVIRWISHRADLYRIPYGGNDVDEMRRMEGWVIEPPPFRGNGFAPGDTGAVVAEFKVDSIRLPHGATMHRLSSIDGDTLVASFDADQQTWLTAEESL